MKLHYSQKRTDSIVPAIQLDRLQKQTLELTKLSSTPEAYLRELIEILEHYADHTRRTGQVAEPIPLLKSYQVPPPVVRHILSSLAPTITSRPGECLLLADTLWEEPSYETRLIAMHILNLVPDQPDQVTQRARYWMADTTEPRLIQALFDYGLVNLARQHSNKFLELTAFWLENPKETLQKIGIRSLAHLVASPEYENFPPVYKILASLCRKPQPELRAALAEPLRILARRSPPETAYFFQELMLGGDSQVSLLVRLVWDEFPEDLRENLRKTMRQ